MINTKYAKVEFGHTAYADKAVKIQVNTCENIRQNQAEVIKVTQRKPGA